MEVAEAQQTLWEFLANTQVLGMSLIDVLGKLMLMTVVTVVAYMLQKTLVKFAQRILTKAKVPSASILLNILKVVVWSLALMTVLEPVFGVQPTAFVAALGVGSVALSLGLQDTMSNIIGGLSLMTSKVIEPGDYVKFGDFIGVVTDINWRSTCVSDAYGQVNVIPNSMLYKAALVKLNAFTASRCILQTVIVHGSIFDEVRLDIDRIARERLDEWYDADQGVQLVVVNVDVAGIITQIVIHVAHGVLIDEARTRLAEGISGRPWVKMP